MTIPTEQTATASLLERLAGQAARETHISAVFIGADTVWKLRKAVRLAFLDFTTMGERERTARREITLNSNSAPGLYRDVVAVTRSPDGLALGGAGEVVDWVVRMARVPDADFLDVIAARGEIAPELLDQIADAVVADHAGRPSASCNQVAALREVAEGNARAARAAGLDDARVGAWLAAMRAAIATRETLLAERSRAGFVRRAHGDLHLGNMCLWRGRPAPFDALEFDEALATIDLGYDLAFLLMDLEHRAGRASANRVLNRYVGRTGDAALAGLLPPFLSMRAMVRAHVAATRDRSEEATAYLDTAETRLRPVAPVVVAIGGLPGTGKSTLARRLAPRLGAAPGALILRSDEIRKRLRGVAPEEKLPSDAYLPEFSDRVLATLTHDAGLARGGSHAVIADATFMDDAHRTAIQRAAGDAPFLGVWLHAPLAVLEQRIAARHGDASDADVAVLRRAAASDPGPGGWLPVDATGADGGLGAVEHAVRALGSLC